MRRILRDDRIRFTGGVAVRGDTRRDARRSRPMLERRSTKLRELSQPLGGFAGPHRPARSSMLRDVGSGLIRSHA